MKHGTNEKFIFFEICRSNFSLLAKIVYRHCIYILFFMYWFFYFTSIEVAKLKSSKSNQFFVIEFQKFWQRTNFLLLLSLWQFSKQFFYLHIQSVFYLVKVRYFFTLVKYNYYRSSESKPVFLEQHTLTIRSSLGLSFWSLQLLWYK